MKKIALLALSLAFIFTLTACSPNANVSNQTDTNSSSSDTPADNTGSANTPKKIAMIMGQMNMDFFVYIAAGAEKAADELGVDLTVWNAASDIVKVGELVDLAAEQGFDAIITPDSTGSAKSAIEAAAGLGIPVVGYDSLAFPELFNATVASDSFEMGQQCANLAIEDAKQQGKDSVHFVIAYNPTSQSCITRHDGMLKALEDSGLNYTFEEIGQPVNDISEFLTLWDDMLAHSAEDAIDYALGCDSFASIGCMSACQAAGRTDIKVFGIDDETDQLNGLLVDESDRVYWGTIAQQPTEIGRLCVEAALAALEGNNLGTQYADASIVTPENVVSFKETRDANNEAVKPYIEAWDFEMK